MDRAEIGVLIWLLKPKPPMADVMSGLRPWRSRAGSRGEDMLAHASPLRQRAWTHEVVAESVRRATMNRHGRDGRRDDNLSWLLGEAHEAM